MRSLSRNTESPAVCIRYADAVVPYQAQGDEALTRRLTAAKLPAMPKEYCKKHPDVEMVTIAYCPACRGGAGGKLAAERMTAKARSERARKAAIASHAKRSKGKG